VEDPFWIIGKEYKHVGYPKMIFTLKEFTETHCVFDVSEGFQVLVPKEWRHPWMYNRIIMGC
jgi:hypothetical protein